jgi:succinate dehydrogenase (ubiquinone) membrane anchor subunit
MPVASFHSSRTSRAADAVVAEKVKEYIEKLRTASSDQLYHWSHIGLAGLTPVALILSPSILNWPVDLGLGIVVPLHMHLGMIQVIQDYVPRNLQELSILAMWVLTFLTGLGLLKINLCGPGITESFKSLWRRPREQKKLKSPAAAEPKDDHSKPDKKAAHH